MEEHVGRPGPDEYTPYYAPFVAAVEGDDVLVALQNQLDELLGFLGSLDPGSADFRYAADKWSLKEVIGHVVDSERVFAYRALSFARAEPAALPGFEQDDYVAAGEFGSRSVQSLSAEFEAVRRATLTLFRYLDPKAWDRVGTANDVRLSVRAIGFIVAGHAAHHLSVIRERYLPAIAEI